MTYSGHGENLSDFTVFGRKLYLPMSGTVAKVEREHPDNPPELIKGQFLIFETATFANFLPTVHVITYERAVKLQIFPCAPETYWQCISKSKGMPVPHRMVIHVAGYL